MFCGFTIIYVLTGSTGLPNSITFDRDARSLNDIPRLKRQSKQIFTMEQYTPRERSEIVEIYIQQNKSIV